MTATGKAAPTQAERDAFEATLRAQGYEEIFSKSIEANVVNAEHSHPFDVSVLVLGGQLTLECGGRSHTYRTGDRFELARGIPHVERYGPDGYTFVAGRRSAPR